MHVTTFGHALVRALLSYMHIEASYSIKFFLFVRIYVKFYYLCDKHVHVVHMLIT